MYNSAFNLDCHQKSDFELDLDSAYTLHISKQMCIGAGHNLRAHSPDGSTCMHEMKSWPSSWNYSVLSEVRLHHSTRIYLKNNRAKFHPDLIWNEGTLGSYKESHTITRTTKLGDCVFRLWTYTMQNSLPSELRVIDCHCTLHWQLKSHLFQLAFNKLFY